MKPEIKQRIEKLNNGELPTGYKKTDFGVFPCDWVTDKRLKDIGSFGKGKGLPGNKMITKGVPCVGYGDIYMKYNHSHFENAQSFVDEKTAKESQPIKKGTLLFTGTGETADEIGKCVCYNGEDQIYAGGDIITFLTNQVNPIFIAYQQYQPFSLKKKASFGQGHSVVHIQKDSLEKLNVAYPSSSQEQSRIAEILMKWDEAIELYDKQIDALTRFKAVCLKKMFPAKGQSVPEWRFQGFSDVWEQRKFSDFAQRESAVQSSSYDCPCVEYEDVIAEEGRLNKDIRQKEVQKSGIKFDGTQVLYGKLRPYLHNWLNPDFTGVAVGDWWVLRPICIDKNYLYRLIQTKQFDDVANQSAGSKMPRADWNLVSNTEFFIPASTEEQSKIAMTFTNLDTLITLHQRKKEEITNQRKALQQYLLNGIVRVKT